MIYFSINRSHLCPDCNVIFDQNHCPICGTDSLALAPILNRDTIGPGDTVEYKDSVSGDKYKVIQITSIKSIRSFGHEDLTVPVTFTSGIARHIVTDKETFFELKDVRRVK